MLSRLYDLIAHLLKKALGDGREQKKRADDDTDDELRKRRKE